MMMVGKFKKVSGVWYQVDRDLSCTRRSACSHCDLLSMNGSCMYSGMLPECRDLTLFFKKVSGPMLENR